MLVTCLLNNIMPTNLSVCKAVCYTSFITSSAFRNIIAQDNIQDDRSTCLPCTGNQNWRGRTDGRTDGARVGVRSREYQIFLAMGLRLHAVRERVELRCNIFIILFEHRFVCPCSYPRSSDWKMPHRVNF